MILFFASNPGTALTLPGTPLRSTLQRTLIATLPAVLALIVAWPAHNGQFLSGDDEHLILNHFLVNHPSPGNAWTLLTRVTDDLYQPIPMISFQVNYALARPDPSGRFAVSAHGFHAVNILLHMLNCILVFLLAARIASCARVAFITALLFACHPFAVEPVAWINGRMILLASTFALLTLLLLITDARGTGGRRTLGAGVSWLCSLLCKVLPTVPLVAAGLEFEHRRSLPRRRLILYVAFFVMGLAISFLAAAHTLEAVGSDVLTADSQVSLPVRVLAAFRYYIENYFRPNRLAAWSPPPTNIELLSAPTLIAVTELLGLLALAWMLRRAARPAAVGIGFFLLLLAPFLIAGTTRRILAADRYMYLPIIGLHLAAAAVCVRCVDFLRRHFSPVLARVVVGLPLLAVIVLAAREARRLSETWTSSVTRDLRVAQVWPDKPDVRAQLAKAHLFENDTDAALNVIAEARRRWPDSPRLAAVAGDAYRARNDLPSAERELRFAADKLPEHLRTQYQYARTLEDLGRHDEAKTLYERILQLNRDFLPAVTSLARYYKWIGRTSLAHSYHLRALSITPNHIDSLNAVAQEAFARGDYQTAAQYYQIVARLRPGDEAAMLNFGASKAHGSASQAIEIYTTVLKTHPNSVIARLNRAGLLAGSRPTDSEADYRAVLSIDPENLDAAIGLHLLLVKQNRFTALAGFWGDFIKTGGDSPEARSWQVWALVLADLVPEAHTIARMIPAGTPERLFANWALARDAILRGKEAELRQLVGDLAAARRMTSRRQEKYQMVLKGYASLPKEFSSSPASLYIACLLSLVASDLPVGETTARLAAQRIVATSRDPYWTQAAESVLKELPPEPPSATKPDGNSPPIQPSAASSPLP